MSIANATEEIALSQCMFDITILDCSKPAAVALNADNFHSLSSPEAIPEPEQIPQDELVQEFGPPCMDSPDTRHSNEKTEGKTSVKCLLVGSSNCRGLVIPGDDDLAIQQTSRINGG